jgi:hypothetical protein
MTSILIILINKWSEIGVQLLQAIVANAMVKATLIGL